MSGSTDSGLRSAERLDAAPAVEPPSRAIGGRIRNLLHRSPRLANVAMLVAGLGMGQGTIFAAQTWLVAKGRLELLSWFVTHYSLAMFAIILVEGGSSALIARHMVQLSGGQLRKDEFWQVVSNTMAVRLVMAVLVSLGAAIYALQLADDSFSRAYILFGLPALLLWAGNPVGLLDGLKLSGISGVTGAAAYAACAAGLALAPDGSPVLAGTILGSAFSLGYLVTVATQWAVLRSYGWSPHFHRVTMRDFGRSARDFSALLFQLVPGQAILRVQLLLSTNFLGAEITALFAYVKQLIGMAGMIVTIVLRVEFPRLVQVLTETRRRSLRLVLASQKAALCCALALTLGAIAVAGLGLAFPHYRISAVAPMLLPYAPSILTMALSLTTMQALVALGAYGALARTTAISAAVGIVFSAVFVNLLQVYAFLIGEVVFHLVGLYLMHRDVQRARPGAGAAA